MNIAHPQRQSWLDWGVASRPLPSETVSGDRHVIKSFDHGTLLAAVDGVGHGDEATAAAQAAVAVLEGHAQESVISLVTRCHLALASTRGVVMTLASLHVLENTVAWIGVGNVEGHLLRANPSSSHPAESVLLRGGVVGHQLPPLQAGVLSLAPGDLLIFATDGVRPAFAEGIGLKESPQPLADRLLARYFKGTDDALVLVARYLGGPGE